MQDIKEYYILCEPIETKIGDLHFLKVNEFLNIALYSNLLILKKEDILPFISSKYIDYIKDWSFIDIIKYFNAKPNDLYSSYKKLFEICFKEDVFDKVESDDELEYYLNLIKKINCLNLERKNPNSEIEKFNMFKKFLQKKKGEEITFESIYTSVWVETGNKPDDLYLYELYALFYRTNQFKSYDSTTHFATVSKDIKIESWAKHIDILDLKEKNTMLDEFSQQAQSMMQ